MRTYICIVLSCMQVVEIINKNAQETLLFKYLIVHSFPITSKGLLGNKQIMCSFCGYAVSPFFPTERPLLEIWVSAGRKQHLLCVCLCVHVPSMFCVLLGARLHDCSGICKRFYSIFFMSLSLFPLRWYQFHKILCFLLVFSSLQQLE